MTQLNGEPQVTDDGDIIYVFPDLQSTAGTAGISNKIQSSDRETALILKRAGLPPTATAGDIQRMLNYNGISTRGVYEKSDLVNLLNKALGPMSSEEQAQLQEELDIEDPTVLIEREIPFSVATGLNKVLAGGLGVVNLGGALYLGNLLSQVGSLGYRLPAYYGTVQTFYPLLLGYAVLFNVIPLVRNFWIGRQNAEIRQRNKVRKQWRKAIAASFGNLARKVKAAKSRGQSLRRLDTSKDNIVFDTKKTSIEEVEQTKQKSDMDEFDKRLKGGGGSNDESSNAFQ